MYDMHKRDNRFPTWLMVILLTIVLLTLGVHTAFAGFCWAG